MSTRSRGGRLALLAVVVALLALPVGTGRASAPVGTTAASAPSPCGPVRAPLAPRGSVTVDGGPLPSGYVAGVTIEYTETLGLVITNRASGDVVSYDCVRDEESTSVSANGTFAFAPVLENLSCAPTATNCVSETGPFAPDSVGPVAPAPTAYSVSVGHRGADFTVSFVYDLASLALTPPGPTLTVAPAAPTELSVIGEMANGSATPLDPVFGWSLNGTGWSLTVGAGARTATVVADPGAGPARLGVSAVATVGNVSVVPPPAVLTLVPQPTAIETAEYARTTIDVGRAVTVELAGVGAAGYAYTAELSPGLQLSSVPMNCSAVGPAPGVVNVSCAASLDYPVAGIAQPTARLSNGYSTSTWQFPEITVDRAPELAVTPAAPIGYAGAPVPVTVTVANGSGAPPFSGACLAVPGTPVLCLDSPGPSWTFGPVFAAPGDYSSLAWAADADGANGSVGFSVSVEPALALGPISAAPANASAGVPVVLSATLVGGDLPLRYWWNASDQTGSLLAGTAAADGPVSVALVAPSAGAVTVSLTVVDALGTFETVQRLLVVGPANPFALEATAPFPPASVVAGRPIDVGWSAVDGAGTVVPGFSAAGIVELSGPAASGATVNATGVGPLTAIGTATFAAPAGAWVDGGLRLVVTATQAGRLEIALAGSNLPSAPAPLGLVVDPDLDHLHLFDPDVARAGGRANDTFWRVSDRYGNAAVGAPVTVVVRTGASSRTTVVSAIAIPAGGSGVWVNYSADGPASGNLTVLDAAGEPLLGPIAIPAAPGPTPLNAATVTVAAAAPLGALGAAGLGIRHRRARRRRLASADDAALRRLAEGRGQAVEIVRRAGAADLASIEAAWRPGPAPPDLAEWLASLVADGTLGATLGDDGRARFCLSRSPPPGPSVTVDAATFDAAERRRAQLWNDGGDGR